jgi:tetratricopeptide (TPR) repeat protein
MFDSTKTPCFRHMERKSIGNCGSCGKPLCKECAHRVGDAVYCQHCLPAEAATTDTDWVAVRCVECGAQPTRYAEFVKYTGMIVMHQTNRRSGHFCQACGDSLGRSTFLHNLVLGWWGFPWGLGNFYYVFKSIADWRRFNRQSLAGTLLMFTAALLVCVTLVAGVFFVFTHESKGSRAKKLNEDGVAAYKLGNYRQAKGYFEESADLETAAVVLANLARTHRALGESAQAATRMEESLSLQWNPDNASECLDILFQSHSVVEMAAFLERYKGRELPAAWPEAYYLGLLCWLKDDFAGAVRHLEPLQTQAPSADFGFFLADSLAAQGKTEEGLKVLFPYVTKNSDCRQEFDDILWRLEEEDDPGRSVGWGERLVRENPASLDAYSIYLSHATGQEARTAAFLQEQATQNHASGMPEMFRLICRNRWDETYALLSKDIPADRLPGEAWGELAARAEKPSPAVALAAAEKSLTRDLTDDRTWNVLERLAEDPRWDPEIRRIVAPIADSPLRRFPTQAVVRSRNLMAQLMFDSEEDRVHGINMANQTVEFATLDPPPELNATLDFLVKAYLCQDNLASAVRCQSRLENRVGSSDPDGYDLAVFRNGVCILLAQGKLAEAEQTARAHLESKNRFEVGLAAVLLMATHARMGHPERLDQDAAPFHDGHALFWEFPLKFFRNWDPALLRTADPVLREYYTGLSLLRRGQKTEATAAFAQAERLARHAALMTRFLARLLQSPSAESPTTGTKG